MEPELGPQPAGSLRQGRGTAVQRAMPESGSAWVQVPALPLSHPRGTEQVSSDHSYAQRG